MILANQVIPMKLLILVELMKLVNLIKLAILVKLVCLVELAKMMILVKLIGIDMSQMVYMLKSLVVKGVLVQEGFPHFS